MSEKTSSSGGIGFFGLLGIVFITLKLTGFIDWSWWWVTAPLWGGLAFVLAFFVIFAGGFVAAGFFQGIFKRKK